MSPATLMPATLTPADLLARLVGFPTVVGQPNGALIEDVARYLRAHGAEVTVLAGPEGDRSNLFASFGPKDVPGIVLSGHVDVVPATEPEWRADPFVLRREGDRLIGRGACDMKGFVAAVLAAAPAMGRMALRAPLHIALSYDEEAGCKGVPHLLAALPALCAPPEGAIIGEPTGLVPVLAHKGKAALRLSAKGRSGHSSRPDLGQNAIQRLVPVLARICAQAEALTRGPQDARFAPPYSSVQIGTICGGQAVNIIPDFAEAQIEARAIAGVSPKAILQEVLVDLPEGVSLDWLSEYPALALAPEAPLARLAETLTGRAAQGAVSFGTEAGLFQQAGIAAIVCGPGDIARAHKPEEYLTLSELEGTCAMLSSLIDRQAA
ncbi:acetylornithine deacetylase [Thioclava sp. GXIMD4215]|uniref:acetylornithine deacetylase n=1 Tax=Thioclava sp. GXIMD4215 TaxID=3131928 RepID=UPI00311B103B